MRRSRRTAIWKLTLPTQGIAAVFCVLPEATARTDLRERLSQCVNQLWSRGLLRNLALFCFVLTKYAPKLVPARLLDLVCLWRQLHEFHISIIDYLFAVFIGYDERRCVRPGRDERGHLGFAVVYDLQGAVSVRNGAFSQKFAKTLFASGGMVPAEISVNDYLHMVSPSDGCWNDAIPTR